MLSKDRSPVFLIVLTVFGLLFPAVTGPRAARVASAVGTQAPPDTNDGEVASPALARQGGAQTCPGLLPVIASCTDAWERVLEDFFFPTPISPPSAQANRVTPSTSPATATAATYVPLHPGGDGTPPGFSPPDGMTLQSASFQVAPATCKSLPALPAARFLVATFADPFASGLRVLFDRALDVVVRAIEARGYERDRYWSPWDASAGDRKGAPAASGARCAEELPGIFLFRPGPGASDATPLVLLVIGETPTWGIHPRAFTTALDLVAARAGALARDAPVGVLGPTFSGSSASLKAVIADWQERHPGARFDVVTGTATSPDNRRLFPDSDAGAPIRFREAVVPDDVLQQAFYRYLHDRWGLSSPCDDASELAGAGPCVLDHVAVLSEVGTAYGQSFGARGSPVHTRGVAPRAYMPELPLPFPLHIASVRAQYQRTSSTPGAAAPGAPATALDPRLDDTSRRSDTPPVLSPSTPVTEDLMLSRTIDAISDRGIQLVGIAATDPADVIFLAEQVRQHRPDIRLFVFDGDVLFTHPDLVAATGGMLLVTPYAVTPALRWGFAVEPDTDAFPASASTGTYVAARTLLTHDSGSPERDLAVWISAIGANGAWPLATIVDPVHYAASDSVTPPSPGAATPGAGEGRGALMEPPRPPPEWTALVLVILTFCAWVAAGFCMAHFAPDYLSWAFCPYRAVVSAGAPSLGKAVAMGLAIGAINAMALPTVWAYFRRGPALGAWSVSPAVLYAGALLGAVTLMASTLVWIKVLWETARDWLRAAAYVASTAGPLALLLAVLRHAGGAQFEGPLFVLRVGSPASYLSPLAPLLLVLGLFYLVAFVQLEVIVIWRAWSLDAAGRAEPSDWPAAIPWDAGTAGALVRALSAWKLRSLGSGAAAAACWVVLFDVKPFSTLEGKEANAVFYWLFLGAAVVVIASFAWFVGVWMDLHTYLRAVDRYYDADAVKGAMRRLPSGLAAPAATRLAALPDKGDQAEALWKLATWLDDNRAAIEHWPEGEPLVATAWIASLDAGFADLRRLGPDATAEAYFAATFRARCGVLPILRAFWKGPGRRWLRRASASVEGEPGAERAARHPGDPEGDAALWIAKAEELVAGHAAICIHPVVSLLRLVLALAVGTALLWALAIGSYMFQPAHLLTTLVSVVLIAILLTAFALFIDLDRDETLSALSKTEAKISWGTFIADALTWIVLPFLAFLSVQYPAAASSVASWLEPASRLMQ